MAGSFFVFKMGAGDDRPIGGIVAEGWSPMLISDAQEIGLYKATSLSEPAVYESAESFKKRFSKFDLLLRNVHADELSAEYVRFLQAQYLRYHDVADYMMSTGRWLAKDVKKLKIVPEHVFESFYDDSDEIFGGHLATHKAELESFRKRASELNVRLNVFSQDALMLRRFVSNLLKKARELDSFDIDAVRSAVNTDTSNFHAIDATLLFTTLIQYSNYARRIERRYLARRNKPLLLTNLFERFIDERKLSRDLSSIDKYTTSFSAFQRLMGKDVRLDEFFENNSCNQPLAVRFKIALMQSEVQEPRTVNGYLSNLRQFVAWAVPNSGLSADKNPFEGLSLPLSNDAHMIRRIFTGAEIRKMLNYEPSHILEAKDFRDAFYWLPKISAFTLMRPAEIVMLKVSNFKIKRGIIYIDLTDENGKTEAARRIIPLHRELLKLNFIEFVKKAKNHAHGYIFDELHQDDFRSASDLAEKVGRSVNRTMLKKLRITAKKGRKVDLYCIRKTGISRLKYEGASGYIVRQLVGHVLNDDVTFGHYGGDTNTKLEALAAVINMLDYSDDSIFDDDDDDGEPVVFE